MTENIEFARRSYERWNEAYRTGELGPLIEELGGIHRGW
jgi:hypothetical protein